MIDDGHVIQNQIEYYRARAPEYDQWFQRYGRYDKGREHTAQWEAEVKMVRDALLMRPPRGSVLELACGTGWWTAELVKHNVDVTAVDASAEVIELNRLRVQSDRVQYVQANIFNWRPASQFDVVFFGFWLTHIPPHRFEGFWALVESSLTPGGRVFFVDNRSYPEHFLTQEAQGEPAVADSVPWLITRQLNDGRGFTIVKVFYEVDALKRRLGGLGWVGTIDATPEFFMWGDIRREQ